MLAGDSGEGEALASCPRVHGKPGAGPTVLLCARFLKTCGFVFSFNFLNFSEKMILETNSYSFSHLLVSVCFRAYWAVTIRKRERPLWQPIKK